MSFAHYKTWTIAGSVDGALTNYQVRVTAHKGSGTDSGEDVYLGSSVKDDLSDVRFYASDGVTALDYWRDESTLVSGTSCVFWVEVPSIPASPSTVDVRIYYEDAALGDGGDIAATMLGGDDFRGMRYGHQVASGAAPRWCTGVQKMSNDDIYLTVWNSDTLQHWLYKTTDGGQTAPSSVSTIYAASSDRTHSNLATDGISKFYVATKKNDGTAIYLKKSTDTGATWASEVTIASGLTGATDPCAVYISGSQLVVFVRVTNGSNFEIRCYESTNDGASFSLKNTPHSEATAGINSLEDLDTHILPSGRILIGWERETAEAGEARCDYIYTDDNCATYSTAATIVNSSGTVDDEGGTFAERSDGTIDYFYGSNANGGTSYKNQQLWVTTYDEDLDSWSAPTLFNESYGGVENNAVYTSDGSLLFFCTRQYAASGGTSSYYMLTSTLVPSGADDLSDRGWTQSDGIAYVLAGGLWVEAWTPGTIGRPFSYLNTYSGQDAVIEALVSAPSPLTQVDLRLLFRYGSDADHYMLSILKEATNQVIWYKRVSSTYTSLATASFTPSVDTLYRVVMTVRGVNPTTLTVAINGTTYLSSVTEGTSSRTSGNIGLSAANAGARRATLARHIFARKYTANPPTISAWGAEQSATDSLPTLSTVSATAITSSAFRPSVTYTY